MRDLTEQEKIILDNKKYTPYSQVKKASNGREYILVKDHNGKKLGARFLSFFNKQEEKIENTVTNNNQMGGDDESLAIDKLSEISRLHDTIMKLQKDIERLESKYNKNLSIDIKDPLEKNIAEKRSVLDTVSMKLEDEINNNQFISDKNTIMEIINDIL